MRERLYSSSYTSTFTRCPLPSCELLLVRPWLTRVVVTPEPVVFIRNEHRRLVASRANKIDVESLTRVHGADRAHVRHVHLSPPMFLKRAREGGGGESIHTRHV